MKQLTLIIFSVFCLTSCSNGSGEQQGSVSTMKEPGEQAVTGSQPQKDPVCDMPRGKTWTDHTIYNLDTVWFCSEGCKMAFEARPNKYIKHEKQ